MQSGMIRYTGEVNCGKAIHFCKRIYNSDKHKQLYLCAAVMPYGRNPISFNRISVFLVKNYIGWRYGNAKSWDCHGKHI